MDKLERKLQPEQWVVMERFIHACQQDGRILAAFVGGSYAKGTFDQFSDLDLFVITSDSDYEDFCAQRNEFIALLGVPLALENFGVANITCYVLDNGVEGDLNIGRTQQLEKILQGARQILLDKKNILEGALIRETPPDLAEQTEKLRRLISWFWHDWMHLTTALWRGQLWWAQGQLETLRGYCVSLLRLQNDFYDHEAGGEHYWKIDQSVPVESLSSLKASIGPLDREHLHRAALIILQVYRELAHTLAREHGLAYPEKLDEVLMKRFNELKP